MRQFLALLICLLLPCQAFAAVGFDAISTANGSGVTSLNFSHTTSGSNRYLAVCVMTDQPTTPTVTYNSISMSLKTSDTTSGASGYMFELVAAAIGSNTVAISLSDTRQILAAAASFTGVHQSVPSGTATHTTNGSGSITTNVTVNTDGMGFDCFGINGSGHTITAGSGQTDRGQIDSGTEQRAFSTSTDTGINAMDWTWSPDDNANVLLAVPIEPAAAAGATRHHRPFIFQ